MNNEAGAKPHSLHTLIPLEDFKALLGVDDREDKISRFCLVTATCTIEQYCGRRLLLKQFHEWIERSGELSVALREYPVSEIVAVSAVYLFNRPDSVEPDLYHVEPDCGSFENLPYNLVFYPVVRRFRGLSGFKVVYSAGYSCGDAPPDLASACLELAAWNLNRYRGKWFGVTGNGRKDGERFEMSMPENVRGLLEPYRRKLI